MTDQALVADPKAGSDGVPTGLLVLADGSVFEGIGIGAQGDAVGEVCFNTAMTGYQEILTDPSYAAQIVTFTFPHIGNVGTNDEDHEAKTPAACGLVVRAPITEPSNWRAARHLNDWLVAKNVIGIAGIDTRRLTRLIRDQGMPNGVIAHKADGKFDIAALKAKAKAWGGLEGLDLAIDVTAGQTYVWDEPRWTWAQGHGAKVDVTHHIVAIDYGIKRNILRSLASAGCRITVMPATATAEEVLAHKPDGVLLSNGPGDPAATGKYAVPTILGLIAKNIPIFGICLGHQMLALALGAKTEKMAHGHHGANHPVKDLATGKVEIVSMNHGFTVARESLPEGVSETHISLFDGTNAGIEVKGRPIFSVQYHPEASPGPHDSHYLFERFISAIGARA
jgi:carbamoyl-phosphate synthase small subunit